MSEAIGHFPPEIMQAMRTIYGSNGMEIFEWSVRNEDSSFGPEQIIERHIDQPTPLFTRFFREPNIRRFATGYAPELAEDGRELRVAQIGCSTGEETWSMAAMLTHRQIPFRIVAGDISTPALEQAKKPYEMSTHEFERQTRNYEYCRRYFNVTGCAVKPHAKLSKSVSFRTHNALTTPLESGEYDAVVMNNVLWHYPWETRNVMLANALRGLKEGGYFLFEGRTSESDQNPDYREWTRRLNEFGLYKLGEYGPDDLLRFGPEWGGSYSAARIRERIARPPRESMAKAIGVLTL